MLGNFIFHIISVKDLRISQKLSAKSAASGSQGGRGLNDTLKFHARKFVGILNGIDTDTWNPSSDSFVRVQYNADDLQGKAANKDAVRKHMNLSTKDASQPLVRT